MPIYTLSVQNFSLNGKTLGINIPGLILVLFKMESCSGCKQFQPIFELLGKQELCNLGVIDVNIPNNSVIAFSKNSSTPINGVPHMIFYINGEPISVFKGPRTLDKVKGFILNMLEYSKNNQKKTQVLKQAQPSQKQQKIYNPEIDDQKSFPSQTKYEIDNNDEKLLIPSIITPYNKPWESSYKKLSSFQK